MAERLREAHQLLKRAWGLLQVEARNYENNNYYNSNYGDYYNDWNDEHYETWRSRSGRTSTRC